MTGRKRRGEKKEMRRNEITPLPPSNPAVPDIRRKTLCRENKNLQSGKNIHSASDKTEQHLQRNPGVVTPASNSYLSYCTSGGDVQSVTDCCDDGGADVSDTNHLISLLSFPHYFMMMELMRPIVFYYDLSS